MGLETYFDLGLSHVVWLLATYDPWDDPPSRDSAMKRRVFIGKSLQTYDGFGDSIMKNEDLTNNKVIFDGDII
jgi:hypothetical protein